MWNEGGGIWTQDYPRADRHFSQAVRRLTRLSVRSVEQPVNLDDGEVYDWPWLYAVQPGHWELTDSQAQTLREYLLRGGFFMCDDFWNVDEWQTFMASIRKALPDREVVELGKRRQHFSHGLRPRRSLPGGQHGLCERRPQLEMRELPGALARHHG
ncbi:MAG: DUF4159 domain-containing protein [Ignavibacteriota bacterium]